MPTLNQLSAIISLARRSPVAGLTAGLEWSRLCGGGWIPQPATLELPVRGAAPKAADFNADVLRRVLTAAPWPMPCSTPRTRAVSTCSSGSMRPRAPFAADGSRDAVHAPPSGRTPQGGPRRPCRHARRPGDSVAGIGDAAATPLDESLHVGHAEFGTIDAATGVITIECERIACGLASIADEPSVPGYRHLAAQPGHGIRHHRRHSTEVAGGKRPMPGIITAFMMRAGRPHMAFGVMGAQPAGLLRCAALAHQRRWPC